MNNRVFIHNAIYINLQDIVKNDAASVIDGISQLCIVGLDELLSDPPGLERNVPIFFGSAFSSLKSLHEFDAVSQSSGALAVNPSLFPNTVLNAPSCRAGIHFGITQPIYNISNGVYAGLNALEYAYLHIVNGEYESAIVCAVEEFSDIALKSGKKAGTNCCGAIYLSARHSLIELLNLGNMAADNVAEKHVMEECTDIIQLIHEFTRGCELYNRIAVENYGNYDAVIEMARCG
ncbi:MAG: hypothetical protein FWE91_05125 [Defluviitaleaceae bacterium]|nr:hypothetical protein [Defluviitaleaceae bacterium]